MPCSIWWLQARIRRGKRAFETFRNHGQWACAMRCPVRSKSNLMLARSALVVLVCMSRDVVWAVQQPSSEKLANINVLEAVARPQMDSGLFHPVASMSECCPRMICDGEMKQNWSRQIPWVIFSFVGCSLCVLAKLGGNVPTVCSQMRWLANWLLS